MGIERSIHGPTGIHAHKDAANNWEWMLQDGLGSVRGVADNSAGVLWSGSYDPFGTGFGATGTPQTPYGFTGELTDSNGLSYLRARYHNPSLATFLSLDPLEGTPDRPMSLNGYSYVEGNPTNWTDPSGMQACIPGFECPASPSGSGLFDNCIFNPYAPGCVNSPNGTSEISDLLNLCMWLNGGACSSVEQNRNNQLRDPRNLLQHCLESDDGLLQQLVTCAAAGVVGYVAGAMFYNWSQERGLATGINAHDMALNAAYGATICAVNWFIPSFSRVFMDLEIKITSRAFIYAWLGHIANIEFNLFTNRNPGNHEFELSIWAVLGALNGLSVCGGWLGTATLTASNTFAKFVSDALDEFDWEIPPLIQ